MSILAPTPRELLCDNEGRPYFLWEVDITLDRFRQESDSTDPATRAYWIGRLMRQAKPDDVFAFVSRSEIAADPRLDLEILSHRDARRDSPEEP